MLILAPSLAPAELFPGKRYEDWPLDDPSGQTTEDVRPIRDEVERRGRVLLAELEVPVTA